MATDAPARPQGRPRPWLLALLGVAVVAYLATQMFSSDGIVPSVRNTGGSPAAAAGQRPPQVDPAELDVRVEDLQRDSGGAPQSARNPFRFEPRTPPPSAAPPPAYVPPPAASSAPPVPTGPPPPPPIGATIKFIGIVETGQGKIGAFSDCKATFPGREGEIIEGRYRIVRIGVESAVLEYTDGTGRTTLPLNGQGCVK